MPGRGQPWKGVGKGNPNRIGTNAIADGSITEADLDSSVTAKLNTAGGHVIKDEGGVALPQRANLDFVGAGVVASDGIEDTTTITIAGGGGSGFVPNLDTVAFFDEFMYNNPANDVSWFNTTRYFLSGTSALIVNSSGAESGLLRIQTDSTIGRNATLLSGDDQGAGTPRSFSFDKDLTIEFAIRVIGVTNVIILAGSGEAGADDGSTIALAEDGFSTGAYFAFDDNASANWLCRTINGGVVTSVDSGVSVTNDIYKFRIVYDDGAGTVTYFISGNQVAQISTNLPTGVGYLAVSVNTKLASSAQIDIDYWGFTTARQLSLP